MKATDLLKQQHSEVKALFSRIERAEGRAAEPLFEELAGKIVGHDVIEREIFYPACEEALDEDDLLGEAVVEHGVVEFGLYQADRSRGRDDFESQCTVLKELILHHAEEEEKELFPKVEKAIAKDELERLGARMEERFEEVEQGEDFRALLRQSLMKLLPSNLGQRPPSKTPRQVLTRNARKETARPVPRTARKPKSRASKRSPASKSRKASTARTRARAR